MIYDIIGDIHGHADKLIGLLEQLGYSHNGECYQPPNNHRAFFIGDLVDRGVQEVKTLETVFAMVDGGVADIVMGNHEYNALAYATLNQITNDGSYLRSHSDNHNQQHQAFLDEVPFGSAQHEYWLNRFYHVPLWVETEFACFVHACWDVDNMAVLKTCLDDNNCLTQEGLQRTGQKGSKEYDALERVLKGVEAPLPNDFYIVDKSGKKRRNVRVRWWLDDLDNRRLHEIAKVPSEDEKALANLPDDIRVSIDFQLKTDKPIFIGHYWFLGQPTPLSDQVVCIDYSAGKGGYLTCYQFDTDNPSPLSSDNFVQYKHD